MKTQNFLSAILFLLALHLLYSNSLLLQEMVKSTTWTASAFGLLFGLSYSLMTVLIIRVYPRWYVFSLSALLDGIAVWLKYYPFTDQRTFFVLTAVYFSLYTAFIVVISGLIARRQQMFKSVSSGSNGKPNLNDLLEQRRKLKWAIPRTKDQQARQEKIRQLEQIEQLINALQN